MDPVTAALALVTKIIEFRMLWWQSVPEATRAELAAKQADAEIRWLTLLEKIAHIKD